MKTFKMSILLCCLIIVSCNSSMENKCEKVLINSLADPTSYDRISIVTDTIYNMSQFRWDIARADSVIVSDSFKLVMMDYESMEVNQEEKNLLEEKIKRDVKLRDSLIGAEKTYQKEILYYLIKIKYRAKNEFGALAIYENALSYMPYGKNKAIIEIEQNEHGEINTVQIED